MPCVLATGWIFSLCSNRKFEIQEGCANECCARLCKLPRPRGSRSSFCRTFKEGKFILLLYIYSLGKLGLRNRQFRHPPPREAHGTLLNLIRLPPFVTDLMQTIMMIIVITSVESTIRKNWRRWIFLLYFNFLRPRKLIWRLIFTGAGQWKTPKPD